MARHRKINDKEFWAFLEANAGIFARTAKAIEKQLGIPYTRQAVRARAIQDPDRLREIEEQNLDVAEDALHSLMRDSDPRVKLKAVEMYLKAKGAQRGYYEKQTLDHSGKIAFEFADPDDKTS